MSPSGHRVPAAVVAIFAGLGAFLFGGGRVAGCLGPLGVTPIQCAKALGFVPTVGPGLPLCLLGVALGLLVLFPIPAGRRLPAVIAGGLSAAVASAAFAAAWDRTWTGVDSTGTILSIDRPLDLGALAAAAILAATAGALVRGRVVASVGGRRAARS
jgi:hypothetical protein